MRNSSIELFRILAAFLVLIVHYNGWFAGVDFIHTDLGTGFNAGQLLIESASIVCVNCFLLISGYFGVTFKYQSIWKIWTLLFFVYFSSFIYNSITLGTFSLKDMAHAVLIVDQESYFVQGYLLLIVVSPVLNAFIESRKSSLLAFTLTLVAIEFLWDCVFGNVSLGFGHGYQFGHFAVMYLVGRTVRQYKDSLAKIPTYVYPLGYLLCTGLIALLCLLKLNWALHYSNVVVIVSSVCLFVPFVNTTLHSKLINQCAVAAFPVYILSVCSPLQSLLQRIDRYTLEHYTFGQYLLTGAALLIAFYAAALIFEQVRLRIMKPVDAFMDKKVFSVIPPIIH